MAAPSQNGDFSGKAAEHNSNQERPVPARKKQPADAPAPAARPRKKAAAPKAAPPARKPRGKSAPQENGTPGGPNLVIVESPSKAKTINKYLGSGFKVLASMGHVRDLPKKGKKKGQAVAGVDIDSGWKATYVVIDDRKQKVLNELAGEAKKAGRVYLATDPDREGEAIAWHLEEALSLDDNRTFRITFNEITRPAVQAALAQPGKINMDRVRAQEARRILDRVVGFPLSGLLARKVKPKSSAGRVQSVALKLVVDREREIEAFVPQEYWKILATLAPEKTVPFSFKPFSVQMAKVKKAEAPAEGEEKPEKAEPPKLPPGAFLAELAEWDGKKFE